MSKATHPNMSLLMRLDLQNLDACKNVFADNFIWHYFNPGLPELDGDHCGIEGLKGFFAKLNERTHGGFQVNVIDTHPAGDELVVTQVCNRIALEGNTFEFDAVVVWRIVDGKFTEAWDIPAVNTMRPIQNR